MGEIEKRLETVNEAIVVAAKAAGRDPDSVHLVAVSKTFGADAIEQAIAAGHRRFGENRVQEAQAKWPALKEKYPDVELHLIGPLQSNKAKDAVGLFDVIETIDRDKIASRVAAEMAQQARQVRTFVQVNTGEEAQKAGVSPAEAGAFVARCRDEFSLSVEGLMCIPPLDEEAAFHFALMAKLAKEIGIVQLSMGMSADFEAAIAFGATHVRVGTGVFGARTTPAGT